VRVCVWDYVSIGDPTGLCPVVKKVEWGMNAPISTLDSTDSRSVGGSEGIDNWGKL